MTDQDSKPRHLRLITDAPRASKRASRRRPQLELFLSNRPDQLAFVLLAPQKLRSFAKTIDTTRPRYIFDLRVLPTFEGAGLSRKSMFRIMERIGCTYIDVMGMLSGQERSDNLLHSGALVKCVHSVCGLELAGPIFFLFQSSAELVRACSVLPRTLRPAPRRGWSMHVLGMEHSSHDLANISADELTESLQPWSIGDVLYVVASPAKSTGWLLDDRGRPADPVNLGRRTSVEVVALQIGQWTDVRVLNGPYKESKVRLASNTHVARLVK